MHTGQEEREIGGALDTSLALGSIFLFVPVPPYSSWWQYFYARASCLLAPAHSSARARVRRAAWSRTSSEGTPRRFCSALSNERRRLFFSPQERIFTITAIASASAVPAAAATTTSNTSTATTTTGEEAKRRVCFFQRSGCNASPLCRGRLASLDASSPC